ncbi:MAG: DUF4374 domain-containing protein [Candidatus Symbiothrix sp.]|jgi:hypothetical protein|nr:DUF4374 domain-containing protein [Candidatus Symbiothrix sp.]
MMKKRNLFYVLSVIALGFTTACDEKEIGGDDTAQIGAYVIAATGESGSYLLQTDDADSGNLSILNNGVEAATPTVWWFHNNKYLYQLTYAQGEAGLGASFELDENGLIKERNIGFKIDDRFTTYGSYGKYIITAAAKATSYTDDAGNMQQGIAFTLLDTEAQSKEAKIISSENILGNGEYATVSGIVDVNNKIYTAICPLGVSAWGAAHGAGVVSSATAYPDSVWIAIYDNVNFENPKILRDNRLSYATSRFRSQYYKNIVADEKSNVYVFSSSADANTTKKSGVIRIKAGAEAFDPSFYFDIETAAEGRRLFNVWHITGDYFLLQLYTEATSTQEDAKRLAVFNAAGNSGNGSFAWIQGLPAIDVVGTYGKTPLADKGKFYMPVVTTDDQEPAIYVIDPATATATKGTVITATGVSSIGKLIYE